MRQLSHVCDQKLPFGFPPDPGHSAVEPVAAVYEFTT